MPTQFESHFGHPATVAVRSPGRVNLIGEHTDHQLLPVMPLAIDRSIRLEGSAATDGRLVAVSATETGVVEFDLANPAAEGWGGYLAATVRVLTRRHDLSGRGARLSLDADLPSTGGLSSSAALIVGLLRILDELWELGHPVTELPKLAMEVEHSLGLENGGMDQTVVALAEAGAALRIEFGPLSWRPVPIPDGIDIVAAYSGQAAHKGAGANLAYNSIVASCRAATLLLADRLGVDLDGSVVLGAVARHPGIDDALVGLPGATTPAQVAASLGTSTDRIVQLTAKRLPDDLPIDVAVHAEHVVTELQRVDQAEAAMRSGDVVGLGRLLDASHESLRRMGVSSEPLDRLTAAMRAAGALGARVTGAGFGGYSVAICRPADTVAVLAAADAATGGPAFTVQAMAGVGLVEL